MSGILLGLGQLAQPTALLALLGGVVIGLIVGSLPGLNDSITMAVLIPITSVWNHRLQFVFWLVFTVHLPAAVLFRPFC